MESFEPIRAVEDLLTVRRVFGEPVREDGVTLIPVARVMGGSGGGSGTGPAEKRSDADPTPGEASGSGGGLGVRVAPLGVFVIDGGQVTWRPALDLQRVIAGGQLVGALALLTVLVALLRRRT